MHCCIVFLLITLKIVQIVSWLQVTVHIVTYIDCAFTCRLTVQSILWKRALCRTVNPSEAFFTT